MSDCEYLRRPMTKEDYESEDVMRLVAQHRVNKAMEVAADKSGEKAAVLRAYYADHPWAFCRDWMVTYDPRVASEGRNPFMPFVPFEHQIAFMKWVRARLQAGEPGLCLKSRECGVSWLCIAYALSMFLFVPGSSVTFATRKEEELDDKGNIDSLLQKARVALEHLPSFLLPERFDLQKDTPMKKLVNRDSGATITGTSGDHIGRGGRATLLFLDEFAFVEHQDKADAAVSETSPCRIMVSTPAGPGDVFHRYYQRWRGTDRAFEFHWKKDPRKGPQWYEEKKQDMLPEALAREVDMSFEGANEDAFLDARWVDAAVDAHLVLDIPRIGTRVMGFDMADVGHAKALVRRCGVVVESASQMVGDGPDRDVRAAVIWALRECAENRCDHLVYDGDGMGDPVMKMAQGMAGIAVNTPMTSFRGGARVEMPDAPHDLMDPGSTKNKDFFYNRKAQVWGGLRMRFMRTYQAVQRMKTGKVVNFRADELISLSSEIGPDLELLKTELCTPRRMISPGGKTQVEGKPEMRRRGIDSPNLADALACAFSYDEHDARMKAPKMKWREVVPFDSAAGF